VPVWDRRLTGKAKFSRIAVMVAAVGLALAVLATTTGILGTTWQHLTSSPHPAAKTTSIPWTTPPLLPGKTAATLPMTGWEAIPAPEGGRSQIAFTPLPDDPSAIFACAAVRNIPGQGPLAGPLKLWRTNDSGEHWQLLSLPVLTADACILRIATDAPQRLLLLSHTTSAAGACLSPTLLMSENGGNSWFGLHPPHLHNPITNLERCDAWVSGHYLYWYEADFCSAGEQLPCDELMRSEDGGKTWQHADSGLTTGFFDPIWTSAAGGKTLLAGYLAAADATASVPVTALWESNDAGAEWQPLSNFPHTALTSTYVSLEPGSATVYPWSIIYRELIGLPASALHNVTESLDTKSWVTLPPLPIPGTDRYHDGIAQVVGVAARGQLLIFGPSPKTGVVRTDPYQVYGTPQPEWLWAWDPETERWETATVGLPVVPEDATISWGNGPGSTTYGTWIWLISPSASGTALTRAFLP